MNWIGIGAVYPGIEPKVKREGGQRFVFVCRVRARPELRPRFTDTITVIETRGNQHQRQCFQLALRFKAVSSFFHEKGFAGRSRHR
jgi:hypothetical protein